MLKNQLVVRTLEAIKDEAEAVEDHSEAQVMFGTPAPFMHRAVRKSCTRAQGLSLRGITQLVVGC